MILLNKIKQIDFKSIFGLSFILFYILFVTGVIGYFLIPLFSDFRRELLAFGALTLFFNCIVLFVTKSSIRMYLISFFYLFLAIPSFLKLSFYYLYGSKINASSLYIIFESNAIEASEFLASYFDFKIGLLALILFAPFLILIKYFYFNKKLINGFNQYLKFRFKSNLFKSLALFCLLASIVVAHRYRSENLLFQSVANYKYYEIAKQNQRDNLAQTTSKYLINVKVNDSSNLPKTYVVIIGESTSSWHMQLYGYSRETNPLLTEIKDELIVFDNVISPHVHTLMSLKKILTLTDYEFPDLKENASIVQLANQSGFSTYWLSNQKPVGYTETLPSLIANASKHTLFKAIDGYVYTVHDGNLLPSFNEILANKNEDKIVFIHLMGTHRKYNKRYPNNEFGYFNNQYPKIKFKDEASIKLTNEYDNAVRYNDFVVRSIIDKVKATNTNSYVLYFSDHGQEVYDTLDYVGHDEFRATKPMYEVPFFLWLSNDYKRNNPEYKSMFSYVNRKYILDDFFHSFSDISNITFDGFNETKSIFNSKFKTKTRWIKDQIDYDKKE